MADLEVWREFAAAQMENSCQKVVVRSHQLDTFSRFSTLHIYVTVCHSSPATSHWPSFFLVLFASGVFSAASTPNVGSKSDQAKAAAPGLPSSAKQGLDFSVGTRGLESLSLNGQSLLLSPQGGELQPSKSIFRTALDFLLPGNRSSGATANKQTNSIDLADRWGHVSCAYGKLGNTLTMRIEVSNTRAQELDELSLRLMELNFPSVPDGGTLDAGMCGFGFKGPELHFDTSPPSFPSVSDPPVF